MTWYAIPREIMAAMNSAKQLFVIPADVLAATSPEEVKATADALRELGLWHLPYDELMVRLDARAYLGWSTDAEGRATIDALMQRRRFTKLQVICLGTPQVKMLTLGKGNVPVGEMEFVLPSGVHAPSEIADLLVTLLATRNTEKITDERQLRRLGIGKIHNQPYGITYLRLGTLEVGTSEELGSGHGTRPCAHLRRGHIRSQHHGPGGSLLKKIWIAPVFVNADKEWVAQRRAAYTLSMEKKSH